MKRWFDEHIRRKTESLDGKWLYLKDEKDEGKEKGFEKPDTAEKLPLESVSVPGVWNTEKGDLAYEGVVWYYKKFHSDGGTLRFVFEGVMTEGEVWLDGEYLGSHYGGFTQFEFIKTEVAAGYHTLAVRADNRFDADSIPQKTVDWYHYGGITRSVTLETLKGITALYDRFEYDFANGSPEKIKYRIYTEFYNADRTPKTEKATFYVSGEKVFETDISLSGGEKKEFYTPFLTLENPKLWSPESPTLYGFEIRTESDDLLDRTGFRKIEVVEGKIILNGRELVLKGVNRHEEHPDFGFAFPVSLMKKDIDIIEDMGCNCIRGSHYPNQQVFVDMLDERGMMFWSEIPIWGEGFKPETIAREKVTRRGLEMHREMVRYYYNHPSIVIFGQHNETPSQSREVYEMSKLYYGFLKENGGNRIITYASDHPKDDICFEFCDVICINQYYGWYNGNMEQWEAFTDEVYERRKALGMEEKPVVFSEFGAAALYGFHDLEESRWSEEYQAKIHSFCLDLFRRKGIKGTFVWQFCDMRTCAEMGYSRARGFNNKGVLNENRRPKAAFSAIKKEYGKYGKFGE